MEKYSLFRGQSETGHPYIHLIEPGSRHGLSETTGLEKTASGEHLPEVLELVESISPQPDRLYLVNSALGSGEFVGFNLRGDWFTELGLLHTPPGWSDIPVWDIDSRRQAANYTEHVPEWGYLAWGYPTFYNAHRFRHHRNDCPEKAHGYILGAFWDPRMHRVILVSELLEDLCRQHGSLDVYNRIKAGEFVDSSMGCFPAGAMVSLGDGTRVPIEEVAVGDSVLSHLGNSCAVRETYVHTHKGLYSITVSGHGTTDVTAEHPFFVIPAEQLECCATGGRAHRQRICVETLRRYKKGCAGCDTVPSYSPIWRRADELDVFDFVLSPASTSVISDLSPLLARLLGYYGAEGSIAWYYPKKEGKKLCNERYPGGIQLSFHESKDDCIIEDIISLCEKLGYPAPYLFYLPKQTGVAVHIYSKELAELCLTHVGQGSKTKRLSPELVYASEVTKLNFVGAYLDGDGGCFNGAGYISTANRQLAYQLQLMLTACGIITSLDICHHTGDSSTVGAGPSISYVVWLGKLGGYQLREFCSKDFKVPEKVVNHRWSWVSPEGVAYIASPVTEIAFDAGWEGTVYNFSVEKDESYCVAGIAVHNCKVPSDECSICHNVARSPEFYCAHVHKNAMPPYGMGAILPDGRKCGVYNHYPRFFDDSFVFIGAERSSKVMSDMTSRVNGGKAYSQKVYPFVPPSRRKVADYDDQAPVGDQNQKEQAVLNRVGALGKPPAPDATLESKLERLLSGKELSSPLEREALNHVSGVQRMKRHLANGTVTPEEFKIWMAIEQGKLKSLGVGAKHLDDVVHTREDESLALANKTASATKWAEMLKQIPSPNPEQLSVIRAHAAGVPSLPKNTLDEMSVCPEASMQAAANSGVVLRPGEFQYIVLKKNWPELADGLHDSGAVFPPMPMDPEHQPEFSSVGASDHPVMQIVNRLLAPLLASRSFAPSAVRIRIIKGMHSPQEVPKIANHPFLEKISSLYNDYRVGLIASQPDWNRVEISSTPVFADLEDEVKIADSAQELSRYLLCLAYWPTIDLG